MLAAFPSFFLIGSIDSFVDDLDPVATAPGTDTIFDSSCRTAFSWLRRILNQNHIAEMFAASDDQAFAVRGPEKTVDRI